MRRQECSQRKGQKKAPYVFFCPSIPVLLQDAYFIVVEMDSLTRRFFEVIARLLQKKATQVGYSFGLLECVHLEVARVYWLQQLEEAQACLLILISFWQGSIIHS